jgi:hypothetical protein
MTAAVDNVLGEAGPSKKLSWSGTSCFVDIESSHRIQDTGTTDTRRPVVEMPIAVLCIGVRTWRCGHPGGK